MGLVYKGGPAHCVQNALGGWLKSAFKATYGGGLWVYALALLTPLKCCNLLLRSRAPMHSGAIQQGASPRAAARSGPSEPVSGPASALPVSPI
jgi:hypothetical protein